MHCLVRFQMENEWSMDFAFPLLSLLKATGSEVAAYNRAKEICRSNDLLGACLDSCNSSVERTILRMGLMPWRDICSSLQELREQFPCWRSNVQNLSTICHVPSLELRDSFEFLTRNDSVSAMQKICINLDRLSACSIKQYGVFCGAGSEKFIERLFSISREAINSMLKMKYAVLPSACSLGPLRRDIYSSELFSLNQSSHTIALLLFIFILIYPL
ncbi:unnamed protein product [Toxocara canis]|uniref:SPARK domain-containing protein n=1 Tax=Toxocara canis TaxID=6265 RepID=A0A183TVC4_TOXCA|nr:unnamed protein product [Toxocara canis]